MTSYSRVLLQYSLVVACSINCVAILAAPVAPPAKETTNTPAAAPETPQPAIAPSAASQLPASTGLKAALTPQEKAQQDANKKARELLGQALRQNEMGNSKEYHKLLVDAVKIYEANQSTKNIMGIGKLMIREEDADMNTAGAALFSKHYLQKYTVDNTRADLLEGCAWSILGNRQSEARSQLKESKLSSDEQDKLWKEAELRSDALKADVWLGRRFTEIRNHRYDPFKEQIRKHPEYLNTLHTDTGTSMLHMTAWDNNDTLMRFLVEDMKANINIEDKQDKDTPLDYATYKYHLKLAEYLKSKGASGRRAGPAVAPPAAATPAATPPPPATTPPPAQPVATPPPPAAKPAAATTTKPAI